MAARETNEIYLCGVHCRKISKSISVDGLNEVFAGLQATAILGGNSAGRFNYWMCQPKEIFEFGNSDTDVFGQLRERLEKYKLEGIRPKQLDKEMFCGGWAGYFSYELGRCIEQLPETTVDDLNMPAVRIGFYDRLIAYDNVEKTGWLIALAIGGDNQTPQEKLDKLEALLERSQAIDIPEAAKVDIEDVDLSTTRCNMDKRYYLDSIEKIKRYIYDGDVYQINFSQRFECDYDTEAVKLFHWQNRYNPSPFAAYIDAGDYQIVSASPEMFVTVCDRQISTKPIKGTRARVDDANGGKKINAANFDQLAKCEKEQAELNMIIDLERNDMARICRAGTRKVVQRRTIESYPTVFHAVATVAGQLKNDVGFCDILKAMFPGGSITGAPKIRSMEIIDETEPTARGVYTGSIGFIGIDGNACLNIAIRTIIISGQKAFAQTGGGIVADSDPQAEWDETITKARALLAGIKAVRNNK